VEKMNGLRLYIDPAPADKPTGWPTYYSRRNNGPYYCWRFEENSGCWGGSRMTGEFDLSYLRVAAWKIVPKELQAKLGAHYME
jgi:hypothetical protein